MTDQQKKTSHENNVSNETYDPHIVPAETAARIEREGQNFKQKPDHEDSIDTAGGYTMDREGLMNNYAIEPEMYVETPGDLRAEEDAEKAEREEELAEIQETDEDGKLTMKGDRRGKGPGVI
ncbi:hypothetical protein [Geitlerinema sp. PCC 7407]|uniref:hypothetical protein n=1 Tax=Geitlerinema sp. PCC 7407 TaxID=1173025 RepID=UPI00029FAEA6|nr:hypothetical protein [Geitlerinema sp. PCC 7407]AFY65982.1 hypothetical protein GEI7407_1490 [Geitlerinema sp. PCC 7407]